MYDIDRSALLLVPRQPVVDWLNRVSTGEEEVSLDSLCNETTVILIPDFDSEQELVVYLKKNAKEFFERQLGEWSTEEETWPAKRDYDTLMKWFSISWHTMVFDAVDGPGEGFEVN